jgi:hypothetical protein
LTPRLAREAVKTGKSLMRSRKSFFATICINMSIHPTELFQLSLIARGLAEMSHEKLDAGGDFMIGPDESIEKSFSLGE